MSRKPETLRASRHFNFRVSLKGYGDNMEIWKPVVGYEGFYEVSNEGRIRSLDRNVVCSNSVRFYKGRILACGIDNHGYARVVLAVSGKHTTKQLHRLIAEAFIQNPDNLPEVNHKDENPLNNSVENLEWCSKLYNLRYGTGQTRSAKSHMVPVQQFDMSGNLIAEYDGVNSAAKHIGKPNDATAITKCCSGKHKTAYGFIWRYKEVT